ncbi:ribosome production factor 1-like [Stylophora pistillata]|uniref:Ribosome production factor 1 n=1 Tax=Stylophora pistillata TaxID=50429 RepID=A0A2B4S200_STYPI|nr:ribosome production factor 1-like [Stylophora pistillata]PFX22515.1 Ribosome production factor 1 [Stylophora pistillata]
MAARERKEVDFSQIKNKQRRSSLYQQEKLKKAKEKRDQKRKRKQEESQEEGEPKPKQVPRTIDNTRVADETIVEPQDEEVLNDEETDEFAAYFRCEVVPKVLITSSDRSKVKTVQFMEELQRIIPNSEVRVRKGIDLKKIIPQAKERGFTALVVVNEDKKMPNGVVISHLPDGPTAHFKLTSVKLGKTIKNHGRKTSHRPEVILNNFSTRLGHSVARLLAALFPYDPQFQGRQCITFHNQRDFIFFRHHRYIFKNQKKAGLQELGPRFTLKLRSLQRGAFDSKFGEYEWIHKRKEMDTSRKKFFL